MNKIWCEIFLNYFLDFLEIRAILSYQPTTQMLISKTYEVVSYESAENGEAEECGFVFQDEKVTFRELVDLMKGHPNCSSVPFQNTNDWFSSYPEQDYKTGNETTTSIHFSRNNPARMEKYWMKAARVANSK